MRRIFTLETITFPEFNGISRTLRLPTYSGEKFRERITGIDWDRSYQRMLKTLSYPEGIEELLSDFESSEEQKTTCLWYPHQAMNPEKAEELTLERYQEHRSEILKDEKYFGEFVIRLVARQNLEEHIRGPKRFYEDDFSFRKKDGNRWELVRLRINRLNFSLYRFEGPNGNLNTSQIFAVCAVYNGPTPEEKR